MEIRKPTEKEFEQYFKLKYEFEKYHLEVGKNVMMLDIALPDKKKEKKNFLRKIRKIKSRLVVAMEGDNMLGYSFVKLREDEYTKIRYCYIAELFIGENARGKNVGKRFLDNISEWTKSKEIKYCSLGCLVDNTKALDFYEKNGFQKCDYYLIKKIY